MWRDVKAAIREHQHFLVTTHVNPDGDGIGAACATIELLRLQGKSVRFVCDSPIPDKFRFLDFHGVFESYETDDDYASIDCVIVLDTNRKERIGRLARLTDKLTVTTVCIDHHRPTEDFAGVTVINANACAVGAMIYTLFKASGYPLNREAATGIYASILCDTGRFCYANTTRKAHKIADECLKLGVQAEELYQRLYQQLSVQEAQLFSVALSKLEFHADGQLAFVSLSPEDCGESLPDLEHIDLEYLHEFGRRIHSVKCIVVLRAISEQLTRVSLRAKAGFNILSVAKALGGGGHAQAAGANCEASVAEIKEKILAVLCNKSFTGNF